MRVFISGLAGFLGSHLAEALLQEGHDVCGNDNLISGDKSNIPPECSWWQDDCCDQKLMSSLFKQQQPDVVVHCAAAAYEGLSSFSPSFVTRNVFEASVSVFSAACANGVKRIVNMSSMARYGNGISGFNGHIFYKMDGPPFDEGENVPSPVDCYGIAKVAAEQALQNLCETHGVKWTTACPHNIIGIRQRYVDPFRNVASIMINRCLQGKPPIIYGDGLQRRCFSPVQDCIPSMLKMVHGEADGEVVNIGPDGNEIAINTLAMKIMKLTGFEGEPIYVENRPNEVKNAYCSSDKARKLLGYKEEQSLDDCLAEMVEDIRKKGPKPFVYGYPIEIVKGCPKTWSEKLI